MKHLLLVFMFVMSLQWVQAQEVSSATLGRESKNALQGSVLGLFTGHYTVNYERLIKEKHGLLIGGTIVQASRLDGYMLSLNYRRYLKEGMKSTFVGLFMHYADHTGEYVNSYGGQTYRHKFESTIWAIGPNVGKRWVSRAGISFVLRIGYGYPITDFAWQGDKPLDSEFARKSELLYKYGMGVDIELSVGLCF